MVYTKSFYTTDDFFDLILKNWNRPVKESKGYTITGTEKGYQIVMNVLGIKEQDLTIKVEKGVLSVQGKTENPLINFTNSVNYQFNIDSIKNDLVEVKYDVADGLMILNLVLKQPKEKDIKITRG